MAAELHVFLAAFNLPDCRSWQNAISKLGIRLSLPTTFSLNNLSGYLQVILNGHKTGFELFMGPRGDQFGDLSNQLGDRNHVITFVPRDETEYVAVLSAAAGLVTSFNGLLLDPQSGNELLDARRILELLRASESHDTKVARNDEPVQEMDFEADALRTGRKGDEFDRRLDERIAPKLTERGFAETEAYTFTRVAADGREVIYFGVYEKSFYVIVCFIPEYMKEIAELTDLPGAMPMHAGGLLAPTCVLRPDVKKLYSITPGKLDSSFRLVLQGLFTSTFKWLAAQRNPIFYAEHIPFSLAAARAWEFAGQRERAREIYTGILQQLVKLLDEIGSINDFCAGPLARQFTYVCLKLQAEPTRCAAAMKLTKFHPKATPLT